MIGIVAEEGEVIDVANVVGGIEGFTDEVIELVEVEISEELAGEVADRESFGAEGRCIGSIAPPNANSDRKSIVQFPIRGAASDEVRSSLYAGMKYCI